MGLLCGLMMIDYSVSIVGTDGLLLGGFDYNISWLMMLVWWFTCILTVVHMYTYRCTHVRFLILG